MHQNHRLRKLVSAALAMLCEPFLTVVETTHEHSNRI